MRAGSSPAAGTTIIYTKNVKITKILFKVFNMLLKIFFLTFLSLHLYANNFLNDTYYINSNEINISSIVQNVDKDIKLFNFTQGKYTKRIKSKELLKILNKHGYKDYVTKSNYVKFIKKSPVNLSNIKMKIEKLYKNKYKEIKIKNIFVEPRGYIKSLPKEYKVNFKSRDYLSSKGVINIKTPQNRKIFFNYRIDADVSAYFARQNIKKKTEISLFNVVKKNIPLEKFRAMPIQYILKGTIQSKRKIKKNSIITAKNINTLSIVRRDSRVSVNLQNTKIFINFTAKALQDGKLNDIITIQKNDGKKLKAIITGKNRVEIK